MAKTYDWISTTTLGSNASQINLSLGANTYTDFRLVFTGSSSDGTRVPIYLTFNGVNTGNLYDFSSFGKYYSGGSVFFRLFNASAQNYIRLSGPGVATVPGTIAFDIFQVNSTSSAKIVLSHAVEGDDGLSTVQTGSGTFNSNSALTSITLASATASLIATGSKVSLYGIKAA